MMELPFEIFYPESTSKWLAARDEGDWTRPELWFYFAKQMSLWWLIYTKWCWWGCLILCVVFSKLHIHESCSTDICIRWCKFYAVWRCKLGTDAWIWCLIFFLSCKSLLIGQTNTIGFQISSHLLHDPESFASWGVARGRHDEKKFCRVSHAKGCTREKTRNGRIRTKAAKCQGTGLYVLLGGFEIILQRLQRAVGINTNCSGIVCKRIEAALGRKKLGNKGP